MPKKTISIDFGICNPAACCAKDGVCCATAVCKKKLLQQEEPGEPPMLVSSTMCIGCGDCAEMCPFNALTVKIG